MILFFVAGLLFLGLDRWTKYLALHDVQYSLGWFNFGLFQNTGIVFSWPLPSRLAVGFMIVALVVVIWLWLKHRQGDRYKMWGAGLMMLGAASNVFDRLRCGYVIDWAYFGPWFPVFNLADVLVVVGLVLYLRKSHPEPHEKNAP